MMVWVVVVHRVVMISLCACWWFPQFTQVLSAHPCIGDGFTDFVDRLLGLCMVNT